MTCIRFARSNIRAWDERGEAHPEVFAKMGELGYLGAPIPEAWGGAGMDYVSFAILCEELERADTAFRVVMSVHVGLNSLALLQWGTDEQRRRWLVPQAQGKKIATYGLTEPGAGSDLASLKTRAELIGDEFVVNGQKVWTSGAHHADWCLCFVRTDPSAPKHKGISALIIDTTSPGVDRRPFPELSDNDFCDFNEVFFTDVRVPRENLMGPLNGGWPITQGSLAHERAMLWINYAYDVQRAVKALVELGKSEGANGKPLGEDARYRDAVAGFYVDAQALMTMGYRGFSKFLKGKSAPEHSLLKLYGSESLQKALLFGSEALGMEGLDLDWLGPQMWREGSWAIQYLRSFGATIPGGTSEIQRNIIAERVLGLPRA